MELLEKMVNGWTAFAKRSILDVWLGSEYASTLQEGLLAWAQ